MHIKSFAKNIVDGEKSINEATQNAPTTDKTNRRFTFRNLRKFVILALFVVLRIAIFIFIIIHITSVPQYLSDISKDLTNASHEPVAKTKQNTHSVSAHTTPLNHESIATKSSVAAPVVVSSPNSSVLGLEPNGSKASASGSVADSYNSANWSGYMANGDNITSITANWTVPEVIGNNQTKTGDATWIGIGGITNSDLIQIGTQDTISANGQVSSSAFYEILPAAPRTIDTVSILPGSSMAASINQIQPGLWQINLTDLSTQEIFSSYVIYQSSRSSAEWIEEDPTAASNQLLPLDNFGMVSFTSGSTTVNGFNANILSSHAQPITMVNQSKLIMAKPSSTMSSGTSFNVSWQ